MVTEDSKSAKSSEAFGRLHIPESSETSICPRLVLPQSGTLAQGVKPISFGEWNAIQSSGTSDEVATLCWPWSSLFWPDSSFLTAHLLTTASDISPLQKSSGAQVMLQLLSFTFLWQRLSEWDSKMSNQSCSLQFKKILQWLPIEKCSPQWVLLGWFFLLQSQ